MKELKKFLEVVRSISKVIAVLMFSVLMVSLLYSAGIPPYMNYQGRIFSPVGTTNPVADGSYTFEFSIFDMPTGGAQLWYSQMTGVPTTRGFFNVELGPLDTLDFAKEYWLDIKFNGEQMTPRQKLLAAPYAARAQFVNEINPTTVIYGPISMTGNVLPPIALFGVTNTAGTAIYGVATNGEQVAGVMGANYSPSSETAGVYGFGLNGIGVYGESSGTAQAGIRGENSYGYGVVGKGITGVAGEAIDSNSIGVLAANYNGGTALEVQGKAHINGMSTLIEGGNADPQGGLLQVKNSSGTGIGINVKNMGRAIVATSDFDFEKVITSIHNATFGEAISLYGAATQTAQGIGVLGDGAGIGVKGNSINQDGIGVMALNPMTLSMPTNGSALYVSGTVKTSTILFTDNGSYTTTWNVNNGNPLNYGPGGAIRLAAPANNISTIVVRTPVITANSVVIVTFLTSQTIQSYVVKVVLPDTFEIGLQPAVNFSSGDGFNYLIIN